MAKKITDSVYYVGSRHWDRRLFDELIPLPDGTTYNSYVVIGSEKTALVDSVDPSKVHELLGNLEETGLDRIDYIISNHAEQDHSGAIPTLLEKFPMAKVVTNQKCKGFLKDLLMIEDGKFLIVDDRDTLSLGNKTLEFILAPWVHWPETMFTYLREDGILFSCDFLGSHLATSQLFASKEPKVYESAKRYYAEIMMPFRNMIKNHLKRLNEYDIRIVAPSHGPIHDDPEFIINAYKDWISDEVKNEVVIVYVSMHDSTKVAVEYLIKKLEEKNIIVKPFNLTVSDLGEIAMALVDAATVIVASPTVLTGLHPYAANVVFLLNALRPKTRFISLISSYGWGSKIVDQTKQLLTNLKVEFLEPVLIKGYPKDSDLKELDELVENLHEKHKNLMKI